MKAHILSLLVILLLCSACFSSKKTAKKAKKNAPAAIEWITFEEAKKKSKKKPRKVLVDLYTDWCYWCKVMDRTTFKDSSIIAYVNENYYAVKLNGETKLPVEFQDRTYQFVKNPNMRGGGYHELVKMLTAGRMGFPTLVFLDDDHTPLKSLSGYKKPNILGLILTHFGENQHKEKSWQDFVEEVNAKLKGTAPKAP